MTRDWTEIDRLVRELGRLRVVQDDCASIAPGPEFEAVEAMLRAAAEEVGHVVDSETHTAKLAWDAINRAETTLERTLAALAMARRASRQAGESRIRSARQSGALQVQRGELADRAERLRQRLDELRRGREEEDEA
jgi:hypothetical protein